jgi:haloalkane dehalogenase
VSADTEWFRSQPQSFAETKSARIAYRKIGSGPPLLCIHGWPFSSLSYRFLAPGLSKQFTCYFPDTPGLGETEWGPHTPFAFAEQAETFKSFVDALMLPHYSVLAHDTGAAISRRLAQIDAGRMRALALLNTEVPAHRPPWIPLYTKLTRIPGAGLSFRMLMRSRTFERSGMGFGGVFVDRSRIDADFEDCYVRPLTGSARRMEGAIRYLQGYDWPMIDGFATTHQQIRCPVLLVWGADDVTFPIEEARGMVAQLPTSKGLHEVKGAALLVHEEKPEAVLDAVTPFFAAA